MGEATAAGGAHVGFAHPAWDHASRPPGRVIRGLRTTSMPEGSR